MIELPLILLGGLLGSRHLRGHVRGLCRHDWERIQVVAGEPDTTMYLQRRANFYLRLAGSRSRICRAPSREEMPRVVNAEGLFAVVAGLFLIVQGLFSAGV